MDAYGNLKKGLFELIKTLIKKADFDKTYKGRVKSSISDNKYKIIINGNEFTAKTIDSSKTYKENSIVYVLAPQNNMKELLIL